ncbi:MAG: response regulator [Verrucomicrobiota bacterium]
MKTILVIDDQAEFRSLIATILTDAGYEVRQAANGREGIVMVLAERPDLILCDVRMPEMDGYRTLAAIREFRGTAAIPFILMTGSMGRDEFRNAMTCGADDYLLKPFSRLELILAIKSRLVRQTNVQTDFFRRIEVGSEYPIPAFLSESVPVGTGLASTSVA